MGQLFVIPARAAPVALVLRRGPSRWYHLILWDTSRDTFTHGAWFKGRIYEDKCDLSTDGQLFVYSALHGRSEREFPRIYTAVSRAPWLHALVVWPHESTYVGGGRFTGPRTLWGLAEADVQTGYAVEVNRQFGVKRLQFTSHPPPPRPPTEPIAGADWTGLDDRGRIVFSRGDLLFRRRNGDEEQVADFSSLRPDPQPAPAWAAAPL